MMAHDSRLGKVPLIELHRINIIKAKELDSESHVDWGEDSKTFFLTSVDKVGKAFLSKVAGKWEIVLSCNTDRENNKVCVIMWFIYAKDTTPYHF